MASRSRSAAKELRPRDLAWRCPGDWIPPASPSRNQDPLPGLFGQDRAVDALQMGLSVDARGYNIFVSGIGGTEKNETVRRILERVRLECPRVHDHVYVHNFHDPLRPRHLALPPGTSAALQQAMEDWVRSLRREVPRLLESDEHLARRENLFRRYRQAEKRLFQRFSRRAEAEGLVLVKVTGEGGSQHDLFLKIGEEGVDPDKVDQLLPKKRPSPEALQALLARREVLMEELRKTLRKARALGLRLVRESQSLDQDLVRELIESLTAETSEEMEAGEGLTDWLADCAVFGMGHLDLFRRGENDSEAGTDSSREEEDLEGGRRPRTRRRGLEVFEVNVVRSAGETGCPSVYELHPNYSNLFGTVERRGLSGGSGFFHLAIRPGSLLSADGGFLVLNARDIFKEAEVWRALKRTLQTGVLQIHALESLSPLGVTGIRPEPIPIDLKVVLIGDNSLYESLHEQDFDFPTIFKVKAEFNDSHVLDRENVGKLVGVLRHTRKKEGLLPFSKSGLQALVERAVRDAGRRNRLSARLSTLFDYAREASYYARQAGKRRIDRAAVEIARLEFHRQHSVDSEWFTRMVVEDVYKIDTTGSRVGAVNALTVVGYGPLGFGRPARISASVGVGEESFLHIEREVELSGPIHSKGGLILEAFIRHRFGLKRTLPIKAALVFDQSYGPIDGDSASSTEVFALLSAVGEIPLRQDLACTGAVTLEGEVLAVGGINQKIEGFFGICEARGLTGTQGVILPVGSREDLMLDEKVIHAVREGRFHLWTIDSIDQGIELLTGLPAGLRNPKGDYPPGSVMGRVEARLREFQAILKGEEKDKEKGRDESREESIPARRRRPAAKRKTPRRKPTGR